MPRSPGGRARPARPAARAARHLYRLGRFALHAHRSHLGARGGFGHSVGIAAVVLVRSLAVGFECFGRHHLHPEAEIAEKASPVMGAAARFEPDQATRCLLLHKAHEGGAPQPLLPPHHRAVRRQRLQLKHALCQVDADHANLFHGPFPHLHVTTCLGRMSPFASVRQGERSIPSFRGARLAREPGIQEHLR